MKINNYDIIADLYDIFVPVDFDLDFFLQETHKSQGHVLELMSGTGRVSIPLLNAGVNLTCVDNSPESNAVLANKLKELELKAEIVTMDVRELDLGKQFAMIIIPFHSFAHFTSPEDQKKAIDRIYRHLSPGGTFICTLLNPKVRQQAVNKKRHLIREYPLPEKRGKLQFWVSEINDPDDPQVIEAREYFEVYDEKGVLKEKRLMELHFRLTSKDEFEEMSKSAGFKVTAFYGDYTYREFKEESSPYMIWILSKD